MPVFLFSHAKLLKKAEENGRIEAELKFFWKTAGGIGEGRQKMRVKYKGKTEFLVLTHGQEYEVLSIERGWYRVLDDSGDDYLYPKGLFEVVEGGEEDLPADKEENWWRDSHYGKRPGEEGWEPY